jgi:hypothetical protein
VSLSGETIIHTLHGPQTVEKLAAYGEDVYCFQWTGARISVGRVFVKPESKSEWTRRIVLDNGTSLRATNDQPFVTRAGAQADASFLAEGSRLMPLYLKDRKRDKHPMLRQLGDHRKTAPAACDRKRWRCVARMVYEWASEGHIPPGVRVRHKDGDPQNCDPSNLLVEGKPRRGNKTRRRRLAERVWAPGNHQVVGVEPFGREDVYDVLVQIGDTFAAGGVFLMGAYGVS